MKRIPAGNVEFWAEVRDNGADGGPSIQVRTAIDGRDVQLLRFDCFRNRPHYHYAPGGENAGYDIDPTIIDDSLGWTLAQLRANLGAMVGRAGYPAVAESLDPSAVASGLAEVEAHLQASLSAVKPA